MRAAPRRPPSTRLLRMRAAVAMCLVALVAADVRAGLLVATGSGVSTTSASGVRYSGPSGFLASGAESLLAFSPNGIAAPSAVGYAGTGPDAATFAGTNGIVATGADGIRMTGADGMVMTGADGLLATLDDGTSLPVESIALDRPTSISTGPVGDAIARGYDGLSILGPSDFDIARTDGMVMTGADGIVVTHADGIRMTGADGTLVEVGPSGVTVAGVGTVVATAARAVGVSGADDFHLLDLDKVPLVGAGLQSVDPELALLLDRITDDSGVNAVVVFHRYPTSSDLSALRGAGIFGGTIFRALPMVMVTATRRQLLAVSRMVTVRSIYGVRTLSLTADTSRTVTGVARATADADVAARLGRPVTGRGVTVAVLDTGLNALHPDLAGRVARNVKLLDVQSIPLLGFQYPIDLEGLPTTDLVSGHGTFVGGVIGGSGAASGGKYKGVAPGASLVGLSAGLLDLPHVLAGFDYLLDRGPGLKVRVVNCSFSANVVFDVNDPVNVATKMLADRGIVSVFSAGNGGPAWDSLNPYAMAPWVVGVGATDAAGRVAGFSSRGSFGSSVFRPKLVAPGVSVVGPRSSPLLSVIGALGIESGVDARTFTPAELPFYTTSSGTSFSAPQVAGTIALMLEVNPQLTPSAIADILQRSATPLASAYQHEAGAGMLNAHAAVLEAAFAARRMGAFRSGLGDAARFIAESATLARSVAPGARDAFSLSVPGDAVQASVGIAWGPLLTLNDLGLALYAPGGALAAQSNRLNLPGLTGHAEGVLLSAPAAGAYRVEASNALGVGTSQAYTAAVRVARVEYAPMDDLAGLDADEIADVKLAVRSFSLAPFGNRFRPTFAATRMDLARAAVVAGHVPQYLAGAAVFSDVRGDGRLFAESAWRAPGGDLFPDAAPGGRFAPGSAATRMAAAVALVRAAGLGDEADARAGESLGLTDEASIPEVLRGYVAVALERGLVGSRGASFDPDGALTRLDLARAVAVLAARPLF